MSERWIAGKYRLGNLLGSGGMGLVYEATHGATGKRVAVKLINLEHVDTLPDHLMRFEREARAAGSIDTQHIVQVLDAGGDEHGTPYIAMELLAGEDLAHAIHRLGPLPPDLVVRIATQALLGLTKAHEAGVIHRDIKSANLFLAARDADEIIVKLLDFGVAKVLRDELSATRDRSITRTGSMLGSPLFMSPEQARGSKGVDARTDLWSLGVVMYEALTGAAPNHDKETIGELILAICSRPSPPVQDVAPWVPPGLARVVHRALAIEPADRYPSAKEMLDAVRALADDGTRITTADLAGLTPSARTRVAPRYVISAPGLAGLSDSAAKARSLALEATMSDTLEASTARTGESRRGRRAPLLAAVALAGVVAIAGGVVLRARVGASAGPGASPSRAPDATSVTTIPEALTASAAPTTTSVRVRILPATARVEVDGVERPLSGDAVVVVGTLGSVHAVRAWKGTREARATIAITQSGPIPDAVVIDEAPRTGGKGHASGHAGKAAASAEITPATRPSSSADPNGALHMDTEFR